MTGAEMIEDAAAEAGEPHAKLTGEFLRNGESN